MQCLIINNHKKFHTLLKGYVEKIKFFEFIGFCSGVESAMEVLKENKIDLIILNPEVPGSVDLLLAVQGQFQLIIVTNSRTFGVQAYDLDAIDYVVKLNYPRFYQAVLKANKRKEDSGRNCDLIFFPHKESLVRLFPGNIKYIEAYGDYINIIERETKHMLNASLISLENKLPSNKFIRVHRKFIVNFHKIDYVKKNLLYIGEKSIPIGRVFREKLYEKLNLL